MGLRLSVSESAWHRSIADVAATMPGLIPVVKGNGYGFGRVPLMPIARDLGAQIAVGTVYEAADVPSDRTALVLTPHVDLLPGDLPASAVLTVGSVAHVHALQSHGWSGEVSVKLRSTMRRYGVGPDGLAALLAALGTAGFSPIAYALHLPLANRGSGRPASGRSGTVTGTEIGTEIGTEAGTEPDVMPDRIAEIGEWIEHLDRQMPLAISHVDAATYARIRRLHPSHEFRVRIGTALWHGDKSNLWLTADVLDVHHVTRGETVGYHAAVVPADGHLVLVSAGSAHGIRAFDDGRSPFHFARQRLSLVEAPHMHTSMVFVPSSGPCPLVGDRVDVQRPLIDTTIDELDWVRD